MKKLESLYSKWKDLLPLNDRKRYLLSQRFTVDYNYNSNHIEGNTLTYGQTELLLLFGKVVGEGDLKDYADMKASQVGMKMMEDEAPDLIVCMLHSPLRREISRHNAHQHGESH